MSWYESEIKEMSIFSMGNIKHSFLINPLVFCRRHFCCCFSFCRKVLKYSNLDYLDYLEAW